MALSSGFRVSRPPGMPMRRDEGERVDANAVLQRKPKKGGNAATTNAAQTANTGR
jgi:hypothetical protein